MTYKRTIELVNPLTDERKFVDVEIERNCSQLLSEEADRQKPDDDWCFVGVHPYGYMEPMELRARIERLEKAIIALRPIIARLEREARGRPRSL
jgi:hypothetical protein